MVNSNKFSMYYYNGSAEFNNILNVLIEQFKLKRKMQDGTRKVMNCLMINLINSYEEPLEIHFDKQYPGYINCQQSNPLGITARRLVTIRKHLISLKYISYQKGVKGQRCSTISPSDKFIRFLSKHNITKVNKWELITSVMPKDPILFKSNNKYSKLVENGLLAAKPFMLSRDTIQDYRDVIIKYNNSLQGANITFKNHKTQQIQKILTPFITRQFSHANLPLEGRFYGPWTQLKKKEVDERGTIKINGNKTIELDYKACFLSILCVLNKYTIPAEPYLIEGIKGNKRDIIDLTKIIFNRLINCSTDRKFKNSLVDYKSKLDDKKLNPIVNPLLKYNKPFKKTRLCYLIKDKLLSKYPFLHTYIYTIAGMELMFIESEIAMQAIKRFLDKGLIVLSVHDSFICEAKHKYFLKQSMIASFQNVLDTDLVPIIK